MTSTQTPPKKPAYASRDTKEGRRQRKMIGLAVGALGATALLVAGSLTTHDSDSSNLRAPAVAEPLRPKNMAEAINDPERQTKLKLVMSEAAGMLLQEADQRGIVPVVTYETDTSVSYQMRVGDVDVVFDKGRQAHGDITKLTLNMADDRGKTTVVMGDLDDDGSIDYVYDAMPAPGVKPAITMMRSEKGAVTTGCHVDGSMYPVPLGLEPEQSNIDVIDRYFESRVSDFVTVAVHTSQPEQVVA